MTSTLVLAELSQLSQIIIALIVYSEYHVHAEICPIESKFTKKL